MSNWDQSLLSNCIIRSPYLMDLFCSSEMVNEMYTSSSTVIRINIYLIQRESFVFPSYTFKKRYVYT